MGSRSVWAVPKEDAAAPLPPSNPNHGPIFFHLRQLGQILWLHSPPGTCWQVFVFFFFVFFLHAV